MTRTMCAVRACAFLVVCLVPTGLFAQPAPQAPPAAQPVTDSRLWLVAGGAFSTIRGDCQTCEGDYPYRHAGSVLADVGYRVNDRMDVGAEVFWMPVDTEDGRVLTTHLNAVAQFRPWNSQGFFVKGGAGMGFIRNWVDAISADAITSKALSVVVGTGWAFRPAARVGLQLFGSLHAGALGDVDTSEGSVPDVMANYWSLGAGLVIR